MQNLQADLAAALAQDPALVDEDGELIKNAVVDRAARLDPAFLALLLAAEPIRLHFFADVGGTLVFDKVRFQEFVANKAFLPDSYTAFRNRIGLTDGRAGRFLKDGGEVVLAWPYKDCVLEGGMTKEDAGRRELFWNTTLAPDEVTRLFEPKAMRGFERWDAEAVAAGAAKPVDAIRDDDNLLIKGNNLLALHSLKRRFAGRVKLIYIDPPYNTGSDGFRYNDRFNHSAWLTFMRNRLEIAKELLRPDGAVFVNLDDGEAHYCKVLMDEVFGRDRRVSTIAWQKRTSPDDRVVLGEEFDSILVYGLAMAKSGGQEADRTLFEKCANRLPLTDKQRAEYRNPDKDPRGSWVHRDFTAQNKKKNGRYGRQDQMYWIETPSGARYFPPEGYCWKTVEPEYLRLREDQRIWFGRDGTSQPRRKKFLSEENGVQSWTWWPHQEAGTNEEAKKELIALFGADVAQNFTPKPERLIQRVLQIATSPGDLVLDFFLGSGTTAAVAHKMGRRWIGVDQMDYVADVTATRLKKVVAGEQGGVSKAQGWEGGGSFMYAELAEWNEALAARVRGAEDEAALGAAARDAAANGYLRYSVDQSLWDWEAWGRLPFDERKALLLDALDANHLYVNYRDMDDAAFGLSAEERAVNRAFYEGEG